MLRLKHLCLIGLALTFILSCKKKESTVTVTSDPSFEEAVPVAGFSSSKAAYTAGEAIVLTSTSTDAATLRWTLPDGVTSKEASVTYTTDANVGNLVLSFRLEATSKSGLKSDYVVKNFKLGVAQGRVTFYSTNFGETGGRSGISVSIDGVSKGSATFHNMAPTDCSQNGYPTYLLDPGVHVVNYDYFGSTPGSSFSGSETFTISPNGCTKKNCTDW